MATPIILCGVSDFKKLHVWQKAHALALHAHRIATGIRRSHDIALRSQIIRAAMSIPANIVEGRRQESEKMIHGLLNKIGPPTPRTPV